MSNPFENSKYYAIINEIDGVYFPIDPTWDKISFSVSGGADSALLTFLVCNLLTNKNYNPEIHIITNVRMWKSRPWQRFNSLDVFHWLEHRFQNLKFVRHENFIPPDIEYGNIGPTIRDENGNLKSGDQIATRSFAEFVCHNNNIKVWFAGITQNPQDNTITQKMPDRNVLFSGTAEDLAELLHEKSGGLVSHPFKFTSKDWIIQQYIKNEILDLLSITRSCEGDNTAYPEVFNGLDYKSYTPGQVVPECNKCFWCQERNWAKKLNGI